jgi:hypothetical protein
MADVHVPVVFCLPPRQEGGPSAPPFFYNRERRLIGIRLDNLSTNSRASFDDILTLANATHKKGEKEQQEKVVFEGYLPDHWLLSGAEEGDHAAFFREHPKDGPSVREHQVSSAEYDAQPHEFRALRRQLELAEEADMPEVTRRRLETRLRLAAVVPL